MTVFERTSAQLQEALKSGELTIADLTKEAFDRVEKLDSDVQAFLALNKELEPIRTRRHELEKDIPYVYEVLKKGSEAAREVAAKTLDEVKDAMRINYFSDAELIKAQSEKYNRQ